MCSCVYNNNSIIRGSKSGMTPFGFLDLTPVCACARTHNTKQFLNKSKVSENSILTLSAGEGTRFPRLGASSYKSVLHPWRQTLVASPRLFPVLLTWLQIGASHNLSLSQFICESCSQNSGKHFFYQFNKGCGKDTRSTARWRGTEGKGQIKELLSLWSSRPGLVAREGVLVPKHRSSLPQNSRIQDSDKLFSGFCEGFFA